MHSNLTLLNPNTVKPAVASLGLEYVAEAACSPGFSVALVDLCFAPDPQTTLCDFFAEHSAGLVGRSLRRTIEFVQGVEPSCVGVALGVRIYPNTVLAALVTREGLHQQNPNLYGGVEHNPLGQQ